MVPHLISQNCAIIVVIKGLNVAAGHLPFTVKKAFTGLISKADSLIY